MCFEMGTGLAKFTVSKDLFKDQVILEMDF